MSRMYRLPIHRDDRRFQDDAERMFRDMQFRMNHEIGGQAPQWNEWRTTLPEDNFFQLKPRNITIQQVESSSQNSGSRESLDDLTTGNLFSEDPETKSRVFRMSFDVKKYDPKEVQVRVEDRCLVVEAKQTGQGVNSEFCRKIQLPAEVEVEKLSSTLSSDGILTLQAPCPPKYQSVTGSQPDTRTTHRSSPLNTMPSSAPQHVSTSHIQMGAPKFMSPGRSGPYVIQVLSCPPSSLPMDTPVFSGMPNGQRRLDLQVDLGRQYSAAQDVVVKVDGRKIFVEATKEEKEHGRTCKSTVTREFDLSEDIDPTTMQAMMKQEGHISILALCPNKS